MDNPGLCAAHGILLDDVQHMRDNQREIYTKINETNDKLAEQNLNLVSLSKDVSFIGCSMEEVKEKQNTLTSRFEALASVQQVQNSKLDAILAALPKKRNHKLPPKQIALIIIAIISLAGSGSIWTFIDHRIREAKPTSAVHAHAESARAPTASLSPE